jgi:hypothetical protein
MMPRSYLLREKLRLRNRLRILLSSNITILSTMMTIAILFQNLLMGEALKNCGEIIHAKKDYQKNMPSDISPCCV